MKPIFLSPLAALTALAFAAEPVSRNAGGTIVLLPAEPGAGGGRVAGGNIVGDISFGDAIEGGVSQLSGGGVQAKSSYTGQLYDAVSLALNASPDPTVGAGESVQLTAAVTMDDGTVLETSSLNWRAESGPIAGIDGNGLLTAGYPNTSSAAVARGTFDLLSETLDFTIEPQPVDPYTFDFSELGGSGPYRVLFGESPLALSATNTSEVSFNPGDLAFGRTYYWQVFDASNTNLTPGGAGPVRLIAGLDLELLQVGDANNPADPSTGSGSVNRAYWMGEFEITNRQYAAFLNAVAATDSQGLFAAEMQSHPVGGINRYGSAGNYTYAPKVQMGEKPVNFISFWSVCRYCNWLHNGLPTGGQTAQTTEDGAYDLTNPAALSANSVVREPDARYYVPIQDEWDKAAYYDPRTAAQNGPPGDDRYWLYPTASDTAPTEATADANGNIDNDTDPIGNYHFSADWNGQDGNVTTVGSGGVGGTSYYGFADMAGNVRELLETIDGANRLVRGGDYTSVASALAATDPAANRSRPAAAVEAVTGFRVAALDIVYQPPVDRAKLALIASLNRKIKSLTVQLKKAKKSRNKNKVKEITQQIKAFRKRLAAL